MIASGCALAGRSPSTPTTRVLGQPAGTPLAVGQPAPGGTGQLDAVSCATAKRCWAVGVAGPNPAPAGGAVVIVASTNGGASWKAQHMANGSTPQLSAISCPSAHACMAVGSNGASLPGSGVVVTTSDGGATWSAASAPASAVAVIGVACTSANSCTTIVNDGTTTWSASTTDFGQTWQRTGDLPPSFQAGQDLSCQTGGTCVIAGYTSTSNGHGTGAVASSADGGQSWVAATVPTGTGVLQSAACLSATVCLAAGSTSTTVSDVGPAKGALLRSTDGGRTWTASSATVPIDAVYGVTCPSARQCAMVGSTWAGSPAVATGAVAQSRDGGATFSASSAAYVPLTLVGISCPTTSSCVAVGGNTVARITLLTPTGRPGSGGSGGGSP